VPLAFGRCSFKGCQVGISLVCTSARCSVITFIHEHVVSMLLVKIHSYLQQHRYGYSNLYISLKLKACYVPTFRGSMWVRDSVALRGQMQKGSSAADEEQTRVQVKVRGGYLRSPPRRAEKADSVISGADSPVRFLPRYYIFTDGVPVAFSSPSPLFHFCTLLPHVAGLREPSSTTLTKRPQPRR
jgi:hypothetical protein